MRGTAGSWHAESGGVIFLITLSLPSLTGVFEVKKEKKKSNEMEKVRKYSMIKFVKNCDPFKVSHVCICVCIILEIHNSLQDRALNKCCFVNEPKDRPALKRIF